MNEKALCLLCRNNVAVSRRTINGRIEDLNKNMVNTLRQRIGEMEYFSIACDESTDISDAAVLGIFIGGVNVVFTETEELLVLQSMKGTSNGEDIFVEVKKAFTTYNLDWSKLCGVSTDGAPAMIALHSGLVDRIKEELKDRKLNPSSVTEFHYIIHQENLCAKYFSHVLQPIVETVNFIISRALTTVSFVTYG